MLMKVLAFVRQFRTPTALHELLGRLRDIIPHPAPSTLCCTPAALIACSGLQCRRACEVTV